VGAGDNQAPNFTAINVAGLTPDEAGFYTVVQALNANQVDAMVAAGGSGTLVVRGALSDAGSTLYFPNVTAAFAITTRCRWHVATRCSRMTAAAIATWA
jgi:hypothetical protein